MSNHDVQCETCREDLRGLTGGHASGCPENGNRFPIKEEKDIYQIARFGRILDE